MKTKITITLDQARSWFWSGNEELRELALQAFGKEALVGSFNWQTGICKCRSEVSLFGCATKEIAEHFGKYFGMLITEAKYGDL